MNKKYNLLEIFLKFGIFIILFILFFNINFKLEADNGDTYRNQTFNRDELYKGEELILSFDEILWQERNDGPILVIRGHTNLPDEARVWAFLKRKTYYITGKDSQVKDGKFNFELGPFKDEFYPGIYIVEGAFMPRKQTLEVLTVIPQDWTEEIALVTHNLQIGETKDIVELQSKACKEIEDLIDQTQELYEELDAMYKKHKKEFSKSQWHKWSGDWQVRLNSLDDINKKRNVGKAVPLFPYLEDEFDGTFSLLRLLESLYLRKLEGKKEELLTADGTKSMIGESLPSLKGGLRVDYIPEATTERENNSL